MHTRGNNTASIPVVSALRKGSSGPVGLSVAHGRWREGECCPPPRHDLSEWLKAQESSPYWEMKEGTVRTVSSIWNLGVRGAGRPLLDVRRRDEERLPERGAGIGDFLDILEGDTGGVAFGAGREHDALDARVRLGRNRDGRTLCTDGEGRGHGGRQSVNQPLGSPRADARSGRRSAPGCGRGLRPRGRGGPRSREAGTRPGGLAGCH